MPVVAGMGGNAGTQSMAVTVRGIAYGQVSLATGGRAIVNEIIAGAANGLITGVLGTIIPLALDRIGKDPATSATIFITTATDVPGVFIFLGPAQSVLRGSCTGQASVNFAGRSERASLARRRRRSSLAVRERCYNVVVPFSGPVPSDVP